MNSSREEARFQLARGKSAAKRAAFVAGLKQLGIVVVEGRDTWNFTHIHALRTDRAPETNVEMNF